MSTSAGPGGPQGSKFPATPRPLLRRIPWAGVLPALAGTLALALGAHFSLQRLHGTYFPSSLSTLGHTAVPLSLGLASWMIVLLRPAMRSRLTAIVVSTLVATYAAEVALYRLSSSAVVSSVAGERALRARERGLEVHTRSQPQVAQDLRQSGVAAYVYVSPLGTMTGNAEGGWRSLLRVAGKEVVPLAGISATPTVGGNESGKVAVFLTDEHGFNNPAGTWARAPFDVALLGDSYAFGWAVPADENIAAPLRRHYPRTINLGTTDAGPLLELGHLREFGEVLRPRIALWLFYEGNDVSDLNREKTTLLRRYLEPDFRQHILERQGEIDTALRAFADDRTGASSKWGRVAKLSRIRELMGLDEKPALSKELDATLLERVLSEAKQSVSAWGGQLWFVFLPTWGRFAHPHEMSELDTTRRRVLNLARTQGLPTLDMTDVLIASGDPLDCYPYRLFGHFNERGYRLVGEALLERLVASGLPVRAP